MNVAAVFIKRPVATTLLVLSILIFGVMGYQLLPVADLPTIDYPTIQVNAGLPGANPDTIASAVATPLEKQFSTIAGITSISSSSRQGSTSITLTFDLDRNIDAAAQDVQTMIARSARSLPPGMPSPPSYNKSNPSDSPVLFLTLSSATLPLAQVDRYAENTLAQRLSMVTGVAQVSVYGAQKYAVRIDIDPTQLAARHIGIDQVANAISGANVNRPTGTLFGPNRNFVVQSSGQLVSAEQYRPIVIAYSNGNPVRLEEVANVYDGVENPRNGSWYNGNLTVYLGVQRQPGTNTVEVVDRVKALIPELQAMLPPSVQLGIRSDRSVPIRESVDDVKFTLVLTVVLVVLVIFLFLRNFSATVIPSLALPFSIVGTFAVMWALNYSLDNLSLMALTLSVGFVVDDAIVMLENIVRHMEMGKPRMQAAFDGSKEISFTIVSMTISLAAVFIPILFMGGIVGRLMHEFAVTIAASILVSGVVSLSLTPMLCSRFLKPLHSMHHGRMYNAVEKTFDAWLHGYAWTLRQTIRFKGTTMVVSGALLAGTVYLFMVIPKGFIPNVDTGQISGSVEMAQGIGYDIQVQHMQDLMRILQQDSNIMAFTADAGGGRLNMDLKPRDQRSLSADQVIEELRPKLNRVPGTRVTLQNPPAIRIGGGPGRGAGGYQIALQDPDTDELYRVAPDFEQRLRDMPQLQDVTSDLQLKTPQLNVDLDREQIAALGLTVDQVQSALSSSYSALQISQIYAPDDEYQVIMQVAPQYQRNPAALSMLYVQSSLTQKLIPLSAVVTTRQTVGPQQINHIGQLPSVTITFNTRPGVALGDALAAVQEMSRQTLPASVQATPQGTAQAFQDSMRGLGWILALAIFVIYVVLGILYESFIHPLTILSGLPSAGFGALLTLLIFKADLDIYAFVGIIMLVGLVKKNGIMMVDFAVEARREREVTAADAIYEACLVRFRPIMMTTMAALMGTLPIALGLGAGAEARRPLGLAVVGGLLVSQTLTLYVTPVFYIYMELIQAWMKRRKTADLTDAPLHGHETAAAK